MGLSFVTVSVILKKKKGLMPMVNEMLPRN